MKPLFGIAFLLIAITNTFAQIPCENGFAGSYPCNQINLLSHLSPGDLNATEIGGRYVNDVWGWTDPLDSTEYALLGLTDGVAFVDLSTPTAPKYIAKLAESPGSKTSGRVLHEEKAVWRDIKVYKNHAYVVSDGNLEHGMQVFDLTRVRELTSFQTFDADTIYTAIHSSHNVAINEETGYAYIVGATTGEYCIEGGLHILDITDPKVPEYVACFDDDGYTHDTQCVIYKGPDSDYQGKELCFSSNENSFTIANVDNKSEMTIVSRSDYQNVTYSHQGWLTEDHRYFLMNDELDEIQYGYNPRTLIWDIQDLDQPILIGEYYNEEMSIDHNLYIHEGKVFESNYKSGLRILDLERINDGVLRELASFDTYPDNNDVSYGGSWSNYPFFPSGIIAVSDMNNGLFILELDISVAPISQHPIDTAHCEGEDATFYIEANQSGLNFQWQYRTAGQSFMDLSDGDSTSGSQTDQLMITATQATSLTPIRCKISNAEGDVFYSYPAYLELTGNLPEADFSFLSEGMTYTFTNQSEDAKTYVWDFGDGTTTDQINPSHEFSGSGEFKIQLTANNGCGADSTFHYINVIVTDLENPAGWKIYPNPSDGLLKVENGTPPFSLQLYSLAGMLLDEQVIDQKSSRLDYSHLQKGIYILTITSASGKSSRKIILE